MLDTQVKIYSVDTGSFYSSKEYYLHWHYHKLRSERKKLKDRCKKIESDLDKSGIGNDVLSSVLNHEFDFCNPDNSYPDEVLESFIEYRMLKELSMSKNKLIKEQKNKLLKILENKVEANIESNGKHHTRELNENEICDKNVISVFESSLTRMIGAKVDEITEDFMVVQVFYFDIIKDLIYYGFNYKGEKYIYFTSSAGQIRTKKCVFIKESVWNKYEKTIMCGLFVDIINEHGGCNVNKFLAYLALTTSASDPWEEFDIDKSIVIDDFETDVDGTYDLIDDTDYSIQRITGKVPIPHTDGAGMILPNAFGKKQRNMMIRLPWVKGLVGVFDYVRFLEVNHLLPIIKDIYGVEHDIIAEDIQVIFTKSQFKMYKYFGDWKNYKDNFKKYNCSANCTNVEEEKIGNATMNYQMLQTLTDITDEEIIKIVEPSNNILKHMCDSVENIQSIFGATPYNTDETYFQKAITLYPDLLNDEFAKAKIRDIKNSLVKKFKAGHLRTDCKYTFVLPDFYAACEYWFGHEENPKGLLADGEIFCSLFPDNEKLDCLRSPHLYREHAIRNNIGCVENEKYEEIKSWFDTNGIYTSTHDLISRILQFDVDGDNLLVVSNEDIVKVAERNMKGIVPLYYNMRKADPVILSNQTIYDGLVAAFTGGNIGIYSNDISKIWNSDIFISGTNEEKQEAIDIIKILCMENNFVIDYAKTLYKPVRPKEINKKVNALTKNKLPHFFVYAKDKEKEQVTKKNDSFVNKIEDLIVNPRLNFRYLGLKDIDYKLLVRNPFAVCFISFLENGQIDKKNTSPLILKYFEISRTNFNKIDLEKAQNLSPNVRRKSQIRRHVILGDIVKETKESLIGYGYNQREISDVLVRVLYHIKPDKHKALLWDCYGEYIYKNLVKNLKVANKNKIVKCVDCGKEFLPAPNKQKCRCEECYPKYRKERKIITQRERRQKAKSERITKKP